MTAMPEPQDCVLGPMLDKWAGRTPEATVAVFEEGATWSYSEALQNIRATAASLADLGVREGDLVGVWMPNSETMVRTWWAINYLGAVMVPINTAFRGSMLAHVLADSGVELLIGHHQLLPRLRDVEHSGLRQVVVVGGDDVGDLGNLEVHAGSVLTPEFLRDPNLVPRKPWDTQLVIYTSGTTGPSKGVVMSYFHVFESMRNAYAHLTLDDRFLVNLPLFHISGIGGVLTALMTGGSFALVTDFSTADFWAVVERFGCTSLVLLGVMATFLMKSPPTPGDRDCPLRSVLVLPVGEDSTAFANRFGCDVYTVFNMSEISSPLAAGPESIPQGGCGRVRPGVEARLVDEHDLEVPVGAVGELIVRTDLPWAMNSGYLNNPEATAAAWRNGWFHTGDAFRRDEAGNYFFVDRIKDAIRRRGENISSSELEAEVCAHAEVREAAAVAVPSPVGEDDVLVVVAPIPGAQIDPEELLTFLVTRLPHFMVPRYVRVVPDLPKTPTAKIQKHLLRAEGVSVETYDREEHGFVVHRERIVG